MTPEQAQGDFHGTHASPLNWEMKSIGDVFKVVERPLKMEGDKPYRRVTVKRRYGGIELRDVRRGEEIKVKNQFLVKTGDFLISERQIVHGACGIVPMSLDGALVSNEYLVLEPRDGFEVSYFNYLVQLLEYAKLFLLCSQGVDVEKFLFKPQDWLKKVVPAPPHAEQKKIAAILTAVDDKLDVIARQIEATNTLKQGLMQTLFSRGVGTQDADGRWVPHAEFKDSELGAIPATWIPTTLGAVCDGALQTGPFGSQLHAAEYQDDGVPVLMPKDLVGCRATLATAARIAPARAEELSKHRLFAGDLLFSRRGDVARFALIDDASEGALCGTGCLKARPSAAHSSAFLAHLLKLDVVRAWLEQNAVGQTMPNMNTGILSSLPLVVPVDRREQDEIALILDSIDSKLQVMAVKLSHFERLKRGLMQKLLTGEWRVSVDASETGA